ncbi:YkgB family protein [Vibrio sp. B172a]|uniref:YkgB family protein n=1 Tax=Vibrio sp. B172a TaxID=2835790 RepID=UPI00255254C2|nr:DUF417 family protein [Vibrio sp. B172a]MDK9782330.1 YkgB family protein [Vibrio sp. B172a]
MTTLNNTVDHRVAGTLSLTNISNQAVRFSIIIVLAWIGAMKFTSYEANAIQGLVESSPLTSWLYSIFSLQGASNLIGLVEVTTAVVLLLSPVHRMFALVGAASATVIFAVTTSFLFTAPVSEASLGGFPAISVVPGQFLLKDIVLLATALSLLAKVLRHES